MTEATPLSPELSRSVSALARAPVAAARSWSLYPPDHPAVRTSVDRLRSTLAAASAGEILSFGVTPETLLIPGVSAGADGPVADAASWPHQHDVLQREGLPSDRIRAIMTQKDSPAFNTRLLRRFINLMGSTR